MRESVIEQYLCNRVTETGGLQRKMMYIGRNGCPDRLVGWPNGYTSFVELKKPLTPRATEQQQREHERLRAHGFRVEVVATFEEVDLLIHRATGQ